METFDNAAVIWFIAGFVLFLLEFALPGFILFFFGAGAWIVALLLLFIDLSINTQLLLFLGASMINLLLFRKGLQRLILQKRSNSEIEDEFIGNIAKAETDIAPGSTGKVQFKGTTWSAQSDEYILKGENVIITGNESITLIVKSKKTN